MITATNYITTTVQFLGAGANPDVPTNNTATTGDMTLSLIIMITVLVALAALIFGIKMLENKMQVASKHTKIVGNSKFNNIVDANALIKSLPLILVALFVVALMTFGVAVSQHNYALAKENPSITNEGTITALVDETTGEVTFEDATLKNTEDCRIVMMDSILELGEGVDDAGANWKLSLKDQMIYEGKAGQTIQLDNPIEIPAHEPFILRFDSDIDPQTAISLIGKTVVTSKIAYVSDDEGLPVIANIGGATIDPSSSAPQGWAVKDSNFVKNYPYGTTTTSIINEWTNVKYVDDFRIKGDWSATSATVGRETSITLSWGPARTISGIVNDATGQPEAGVTVVLYDNDDNIISSTTTTDDGKYTLPLHVDDEGYVKYLNNEGDPNNVLVGSDEVVDTSTSAIEDKTVEPGYIVEGTVTDPSGLGVGGVEASFKFIDDEGEVQEFKAKTGDDGTYSVAIKSGTDDDPIIYDYTLFKEPDVNYSDVIEAGSENPSPVDHQIKDVKYVVTVDFGTAVIDESTVPNLWIKDTKSTYKRSFEEGSNLTVVNIEWRNVAFTSGVPSGTRFSGFNDTDRLIIEDITVNAAWLPEEKDGLYKYSVDELIQISNDISDKVKLSIAWDEFYAYSVNGFYRDPVSGKFTGADNSVPMSKNPNAYNHWAMDKNGKLYGEEGFLDNDKDTVQCRIVGLRQSINSDIGVVGLIFMTTHSLNTKDTVYNSKNALFGWDGSESGGMSDIQKLLNPDSDSEVLVPQNLYDKITSVDVYHGIASNRDTIVSSKNKLWCASRHEVSNYVKEQSPYYAYEGSYFSALEENGITGGNALAGLLNYQDGTEAVDAQCAWLRSLVDASSSSAQSINRYGGTTSTYFITSTLGRLVPCFVLGECLTEAKVTFNAGDHGKFYTDEACTEPISVVKVPIGSAITSDVTASGLNYISINYEDSDHKFYVKAENAHYEFKGFEGIPPVGKVMDHITITANFEEIPYVPTKKLKEYTLEELQKVSIYLGDESHCVIGDKTYDDFKYYLEHGITADGSDNATLEIEDNHWAYYDGSETFEFRIIGIHQDVKENGTYAGLTFMATHAVGAQTEYNTKPEGQSPLANYGWGGTLLTDDGCSLQHVMNSTDLPILPSELLNNILPVKKYYGTSSKAEGGSKILSVFNKVWAPSVVEIANYSTEEFPLYAEEGNYYMAFESLGHTVDKFGALTNLGRSQDGSSAIGSNVWLRSLTDFKATSARLINTHNGSPLGSNYVNYKNAMCPCFCL